MKPQLCEVLPDTDDWALREAALAAMGCHDRARRLNTLRVFPAQRLSELHAFAIRNRIGPIVAHAVLDARADSPQSELEPWRALHDASVHRMEVLMRVLDDAAAALHDRDIRLIALKNAGIARGIHACAACTPMGDLDVLVDPARFHEAHEVLLGSGFALASRSKVEPADLEQMFASGGTEYLREVDGEEVWFELQWRPVAGRWIRRDQEPTAADLIARSCAIPGSHVRLLCPEDNLLQVCLHTAKHSYVRAPGLRLHTDVDRIVGALQIDWDRFTAQVDSLSVRTASYLSLATAAAMLDTPVPAAVLEHLQPARWRLETLLWWLRRVDIFEPDRPKFNRPEMLAFHALLYDDTPGLVASVLDVEPHELGVRQLPQNLGRGAKRVWDVITRYQA